MIRALPSEAVHRICAGQVITDLASVLKEVVENALDAGASRIEARFSEQGLQALEVVDNGTGIQESEFEMLTLRHATSKLSNFEDLKNVSTLGFRGEALASLCAVGSVIITTRHSSSAVGNIITFDNHGSIVSRSICARDIGTSVKVLRVFERLPVRRKELERHIKREFGKCVDLMTQYAIVGVDKAVVLRNGEKVVLATERRPTMLENWNRIFGKSSIVVTTFSVSLAGEKEAKVQGVACNREGARATSDRQFLFLNARPIHHVKILKAINDAWRSQHTASVSSYPCFGLNIVVPHEFVDINVTPDKRKVFFVDEDAFVSGFRAHFSALWGDQLSAFTLQVGSPLSTSRPVPQSQVVAPPKRSDDSLDSGSNSVPSAGGLSASTQSSGWKVTNAFKEDAAFVQSQSRVHLSLSSIRSRFDSRSRGGNDLLSTVVANPVDHVFNAGLDPNENAECEKELSKQISKDDFTRMKIIGQFNKGFILAMLDNHLFIIDQHASDEIHNFFKLQATTKLHTQKLIIAKKLPLGISDIDVVRDHSAAFLRNGFRFEDRDDGLYLSECPFSGKVLLGEADFQDLLQKVKEDPVTQTHQPSRIRSMFASRACRSSIMIGDSLDMGEMIRVVRNMSITEKPWACPHGRPTMRHCVDLAQVDEMIQKLGADIASEGGSRLD
eukprot:ANDGO_00801.mRNA.1 DNA mismatch repair protein PMS1